MDNNVDDFLAHFGVKGMKWGVKRSPAQLATSSGSRQNGSSGDAAAPPKQGMSRKKKLAIGAGIVGGVAVVALGAYAVNKQVDTNKLIKLGEMRKAAETNLAGKKAAQAQIQAFGKKSKWELASELPAKKTTLSSKEAKALANRTFDEAMKKQALDQRLAAVKNTLDKSGSTPMNKVSRKQKIEQEKQAAIRNHFDNFAKKSMWELAAQPAKKPTSSYTSKERKSDTKLYGPAGAARIQKKVDKGGLLSEARKSEATRQNGVKALKIAMNVNSAGRKESKEFNRLRKQNGKG